MNDFELLQSYAHERCEEAFRTLATRYIDLVYSAAWRQTGQVQAAQDVTQAVFMVLARKAGTIRRETVLAGWLLRTTRFTASNARRLENRRRHYEGETMQSDIYPTETEAAWKQVAPLLDEALEHLGEKDRIAILLRFFEKKTLKQVGVAMGVSEDSAQKRVTRAIDKLRILLARRGKAVSMGALSGGLAVYSVQAAPGSLAAVLATAFRLAGTIKGAGVATLGGETLKALAREHFKILAVRFGSIAMLIAMAVVILTRKREPEAKTQFLAKSTPPPSSPAPAQVALGTPAKAGVAGTPLDMAEMQMRVLDSQTDAPVTNARLTLVSETSADRTTNSFVTDEKGATMISYSPMAGNSWSHQIEIFRDGYVPKFLSWSKSQEDHIGEIPAEYTLKLDPAVTIGGVVLDEQQAPISGVRVVFSVSGPSPGASRSRERLTMMGDYHVEATDERGRWTCSHVPKRFGMIDYRLVHPRYQEKLYASDSPDSPATVGVERVAEMDLLAAKSVMQIKSGLIIVGAVIDEAGQPVAGAKITQDFAFRDPQRTSLTSDEGTFQFHNGCPREVSLTVQAEGLAPLVTTVFVDARAERLRVTLPHGQLLLGRVVDELEQPIAHAIIKPRSPTADSRTIFEWHTKSDTEGRFSWENAPSSQEYAVEASEHESEGRIQLIANGTEQVIKLTKQTGAPVRIVIQVVEAETKRPPSGARVQIWETTREKNGSLSSFTTRPEDAGTDGILRLKTSPGAIRYALEAQADGYRPCRLTNEVTAVGNVHLQMELSRSPLCSGVVLTPKGEFAARATLVICSHNEWAQMSQPGKLGIDTFYIGTISDGEGQFRLPPKYAPESVVIAHAEGFQAVPYDKMSSNVVITLQPWGRIEGTLRLNGKPLDRAGIRLDRLHDSDGSPHVSMAFDVQTDQEGRFVFETVPPGEWMVEHAIRVRPLGKLRVDSPIGSHGVPVRVHPGETARLNLGGTGRPVLGRTMVPGNTRPILWTENSVVLTLKAASGVPQLAQVYGAVFAADGSFRIEDVPSADYKLKINLLDLPTTNFDNVRENLRIIGSLEMDVNIPPTLGDGEEQPVDLGILRLTTASPGSSD